MYALYDTAPIRYQVRRYSHSDPSPASRANTAMAMWDLALQLGCARRAASGDLPRLHRLRVKVGTDTRWGFADSMAQWRQAVSGVGLGSVVAGGPVSEEYLLGMVSLTGCASTLLLAGTARLTCVLLPRRTAPLDRCSLETGTETETQQKISLRDQRYICISHSAVYCPGTGTSTLAPESCTLRTSGGPR